MNNSSPQLSSGMRFIFSRLFPWPFIIAGALVLCFGVCGLYLAWESARWPVAEGRILNSDVEYGLGGTGSGIYHAKGRGTSGTYHAEVQYAFTVGGREHRGSRIAFGDYGASQRAHAQAIVDRYPKDKVVPVHYRAGAPGICVLEPGIQAQAWFLPGFGLVFLVAGTLLAVFLPKVLKKREPFGHRAGGAPAAGGEYRPVSLTKYTWKMGVLRYNIIGLGFAAFCVLFSLLFATIIVGVFECSDTLKTVLRCIMYAVAGLGCLGLLQTAVNLALGISPYFEIEGTMLRNYLPRPFGYKRVEIDLSQQAEFAKTRVNNVVGYRFTDKHGVETTTNFIFGTPMEILIQKIREVNPAITITEISGQDEGGGDVGGGTGGFID